MRALVTGASGFVGGYVVRELLRRGHSVTGLVRREAGVSELAKQGLRVVVGDISRAETLLAAVREQDVVIHLAAVVGKDPGGWEHHLAHGVAGTRNVLAAARTAAVPHFVHLSSCVVYKPPSGPRSISEDDALEDEVEPWNHYLRQKLACEEVVRNEAMGLPVTVLRPPTVIGAGDPNLVPLLSAISRSPLGYVAADHNHHFPVIVAEDLAGGIAQAASRPEAATYNLASDERVTKSQLLQAFQSAGAALGAGSFSRALLLGAAARAVRGAEKALGIADADRARRLRELLVRRLENHAHRRAQPDLLIDTTRARNALGFRGAAELKAAIGSAVAWHLALGVPKS